MSSAHSDEAVVALLLELRSAVQALQDEVRSLKAPKLPPGPPAGLSLTAAAQDAGVSVETMRRWARQQKLGHHRGGRWHIDPARLAEYLAAPRE